MYSSTSSTDPRLASAHTSVGQILHRLAKLIAAAARKSGWSQADIERMAQRAGMEYFASLSRGESPEQALNRALATAERARSIEFIREAGSDLRAQVGALSVLLERQLDPAVRAEREIIDTCKQTFVEALRNGKQLDAAFDQARAASRSRARAVAA